MPTTSVDDYDDIEAAIPATTVRLDSSNRVITQSKESETSSKDKDNDKALMPPPSLPMKTQIRYNCHSLFHGAFRKKK